MLKQNSLGVNVNEYRINNFKNLIDFINYLSSRTSIDTIIVDKIEFSKEQFQARVILFQPDFLHTQYYNSLYCFINSITQNNIASFNTIFKTSKYFIVVHTQANLVCNHLKQLGINFLESNPGKGCDYSIIIGGTDINYQEQKNQKSVATLLHVFNEADMIRETLHFLIDQGLHIHVIDNWSTDGTWEIVSTFPINLVTKERFPHDGPSDYFELYKQTEYSEFLASQLPYDWFMHYDTDELRYSPWKDVSLRNAISFVDHLGYNAIDFTILDFRYTLDNQNIESDFEKHNRWFEFGKRPGHFMQVKGWKKQSSIDLKSTGGHSVQFEGRKIYPVKFLTKHYSLRSKEQATKKLSEHRLPRIKKERGERGWHGHLDIVIEQQIKGWQKADLLEWKAGQFEQDYLLQRISGIGIIDV